MPVKFREKYERVVLLRVEYLAEPGLSETKIVADGVDGLAERGSRLFGRHATKISHLDQLGEMLILLRERIESPVEVQ
jgi:hypothetical protein